MHPEIRKKVEEEINANVPEGFDLNNLTPEIIENCEELSYFCKELL